MYIPSVRKLKQGRLSQPGALNGQKEKISVPMDLFVRVDSLLSFRLSQYAGAAVVLGYTGKKAKPGFSLPFLYACYKEYNTS